MYIINKIIYSDNAEDQINDNKFVDQDVESVVVSELTNLDEIRLKVKEYFRTVKGIGGPRVRTLFKKLNETLENPDSETKQTVK